MADVKDAVEEYLDLLIEGDPSAEALVAAYECNEALIQALIAARQGAEITQRALAQRMETSQSVVVHLEAGHSDPRLSTIARYAAALGKVVAWRLEDAITPESGCAAPGAFVPSRPRPASPM